MKVKKESMKEAKQSEVSNSFCLVVTSPFRNYSRGDRIHDQAEMTAILGCHEKHMVNKTSFNYE